MGNVVFRLVISIKIDTERTWVGKMEITMIATADNKIFLCKKPISELKIDCKFRMTTNLTMLNIFHNPVFHVEQFIICQ